MKASPKYDLITPDDVRRLFDYEPKSGNLVWKDSRHAHRNGSVAGYRSKRRAIYIVITASDGKCYTFLGHLLVWAWVRGVWPTDEIDHINGDDCDNRIENLRECSHSENLRNQNKVFGEVPFKGVTRSSSKSDRFEASIRVNRKAHYLGTFSSPQEAACAYDTAAVRFFGDFAKTNAALGLLS